MSANNLTSLISLSLNYNSSLYSDAIFLCNDVLGERVIILINAILKKHGRKEVSKIDAGPVSALLSPLS